MFSLQSQAWKGLIGRLDRLPHALLFHGQRGVGKLALAERFAQALLCEAGAPAKAPCGACDGCRWFAGGQHPDFRRLEPEAIAKLAPVEDDAPEAGSGGKRKPSTEIKVDQVRELAGFLNVGSHRGARRVTLVHPAEAMNANAANALLKGLEEPPPGACFLLVSHQPARLPATIRSRCVAVPVALPDAAQARAWLETQGVARAAAWLAFAGGAPLLALEYATGEKAATIERMLRTLADGDPASLGAIGDRDDLELLCEVLQKLACDGAFAALCGRRRFTEGSGPIEKAGAAAWLAFARRMGENRAIARHPLNPKLFAAEMLRDLPKS